MVRALSTWRIRVFKRKPDLVKAFKEEAEQSLKLTGSSKSKRSADIKESVLYLVGVETLGLAESLTMKQISI